MEDKTIQDLKTLMQDFEYMIEEGVISDYYFNKGNMDPHTTRALIVYDIGVGKVDMSRMDMLDQESKAMLDSAGQVGDFADLQQNMMMNNPAIGGCQHMGQPGMPQNMGQPVMPQMPQGFGQVPPQGRPPQMQQHQQEEDDPFRVIMPDFSAQQSQQNLVNYSGNNSAQQHMPQQQQQSAFSDLSQGESMVTQGSAPSIDISQDLFRETLLQMRIKLGSDASMLQSCKTIYTLLNNVHKHPTEEKYRKVRLTNETIKKDIASSDPACFLLEMLGFEKVEFPFTNKQGQTSLDMHYLLLADLQDIRELQIVVKILDDIVHQNSLRPLMAKMGYLNNEQPSRAAIPVNHKRQAQLNQIANGPKIAKNKLAEAAAARKNRNLYYPEIAEQQRNNLPQQLRGYDTYEGQLKYYRQSRQQQMKRQRPRELTLKDTQKLVDQDTRSRNNAESAGKGASEQMGIRALELTNQFRAEHNLPALSWNQALHDIGAEHSYNMGIGKVPFSHDGFSDRNAKVPFFKRSFSENVAYNMGCADAVETAVRGWINSPGHRKNMLATNSVCGIAVYNAAGRYYFTQLFALA